jgi:hypothetical protein
VLKHTIIKLQHNNGRNFGHESRSEINSTKNDIKHNVLILLTIPYAAGGGNLMGNVSGNHLFAREDEIDWDALARAGWRSERVKELDKYGGEPWTLIWSIWQLDGFQHVARLPIRCVQTSCVVCI